MTFNNISILSSAEYGSTFQKLNDEKSDLDMVNIVLPVNHSDLFFSFSNKKGHTLPNDDIALTPIMFINTINQLNFRSVLMLSALYSQDKSSQFYKDVLSYFNDTNIQQQYFNAARKNTIMSCRGQFYKYFKKLKSAGVLSGKELLNMVVQYNRALYFYHKKYINSNFDTIIYDATYNVDGESIDYYLPIKRQHAVILNNKAIDYYDGLNNTLNKMFDELSNIPSEKFNNISDIKQLIGDFILNYYHNKKGEYYG